MNPIWTNRVDSALKIVKKYDPDYYDTIIKYCKTIGFWRGSFSTVENNKINPIYKGKIERRFNENLKAKLYAIRTSTTSL